jgi:hypothetical protein
MAGNSTEFQLGIASSHLEREGTAVTVTFAARLCVKQQLARWNAPYDVPERSAFFNLVSR